MPSLLPELKNKNEMKEFNFFKTKFKSVTAKEKGHFPRQAGKT